MARRASATFWNAVITVLRYWARAWSNAALAASSRWKRAPPWKIGWVTAPVAIHHSLPEPNSWSTAGAVLPALAVRVTLGSRLAMATPIWALAAHRFASAARM